MIEFDYDHKHYTFKGTIRAPRKGESFLSTSGRVMAARVDFDTALIRSIVELKVREVERGGHDCYLHIILHPVRLAQEVAPDDLPF